MPTKYHRKKMKMSKKNASIPQELGFLEYMPFMEEMLHTIRCPPTT